MEQAVVVRGRCLALPVTVRLQRGLAIGPLSFSDYYAPVRDGLRCTTPALTAVPLGPDPCDSLDAAIAPELLAHLVAAARKLPAALPTSRLGPHHAAGCAQPPPGARAGFILGPGGSVRLSACLQQQLPGQHCCTPLAAEGPRGVAAGQGARQPTAHAMTLAAAAILQPPPVTFAITAFSSPAAASAAGTPGLTEPSHQHPPASPQLPLPTEPQQGARAAVGGAGEVWGIQVEAGVVLGSCPSSSRVGSRSLEEGAGVAEPEAAADSFHTHGVLASGMTQRLHVGLMPGRVQASSLVLVFTQPGLFQLQSDSEPTIEQAAAAA
ncbi:hypothetical protein HaLaN_09817 [Haematococcus lacustris]|uniref:Uncharacterized protein n=1 Tax=Haematococcus lacustris TaxID=44745 RepID=A0A699YVV1_HAELA|nr:hypothetical protein HaLaN_09817 [Haematococcus lacustris]